MDSAVMLTLASITYRGCDFNLSDPHGRRVVYDEMARCFKKFSRVRNEWDIVWGPAGFRPGVVGLDESAMYVAQKRGQEPILAIAVRGTNFFSFSDWVSNLLIEQEPWPYGDPLKGSAAKISCSGALGLRILQRLRAARPEATSAAADDLWNTAQRWTASREARLGYLLLSLAQVRGAFRSNSLADVEQWIRQLAPTAPSSELQTIIEYLDHVMTRSIPQNLDESGLIGRIEQSQERFAASVALLDFLRAFVLQAHPRPVTIYVTGHSKGGALCAAVALWLADTRGNQTPAAERWDPNDKATLHAYSFAAPTIGNAEFATYCESKLSSFTRVANPLDIVPHVWNVDDVSNIPQLYGGALAPLEGLITSLLPELKKLNFQHIGREMLWELDPLENRALLEEISFQHLDAYLRKLDLINEMTTKELFQPIE